MSMHEIRQLLLHQVRVLEKLEARFVQLLATGQLTQWSAQDVCDALRLSAQHKLLAMEAIDRENVPQAVNNIDTVLYIMSGFVEGSDCELTEQQFN
jgi:hypothetical protein